MTTKLSVASVYVLDQDEALDFYVNKLGLVKAPDIKQGRYRWLTVRVPASPASRSPSSNPARRSTMTRPPTRSAS